MNRTETTTDQAIDPMVMLIINVVINIITLIINTHQSYNSSACKSECFGKDLLKIDTHKTKFDV